MEALQQQLLDRNAQLAALQQRASSDAPDAGPNTAAQSHDRTPTAQPQAVSSQRGTGDAISWSVGPTAGPAPSLQPQQTEVERSRRMSREAGAMLRGSSTNPLFVEARASDCTPAASTHPPVFPVEPDGGSSHGHSEGQTQAALIAELQHQVAELQQLRAAVTQPPSLEQSAYTPTSAVAADPRQSFSESGCTPGTAPSAALGSAATWREQACRPSPGVGVTGDSGHCAAVAPSGGGRSDAEAQAPVHLLLFDAATNTAAPSVDAGSNTAGRTGCKTERGSGGGALHEGDVSVQPCGAAASRCTRQVITQPCTILLVTLCSTCSLTSNLTRSLIIAHTVVMEAVCAMHKLFV